MAPFLVLGSVAVLLWPSFAGDQRTISSPRAEARTRAPTPSYVWFATIPVGLAIALEDPLAGVTVVLAGPTAQWWHGRRQTEDVKRARREAVPETLDLITIAVGSGLTVHGAIQLVADVGPGVVRNAFEAVLGRSSSGQPLARALPGLSDELGEAYQPMVTALIASVRDGAPLGQLLARLGDNARLSRRRRAEERARRLPVVMMFPLAVCSMPAVLVGTIVPLVVVGFRSAAF